MTEAICVVRFRDSSLMHYGVSGQKKGVRRYQNEDGSLTPEGKEHYGVGNSDKKQKNNSIEESRSDLNKSAAKGFVSALKYNVAGRSIRRIGQVTAFYAKSPKMRAAGKLIESFGKGMVYGSRFSAACNLGGWFLGNMVLSGLDRNKNKKTNININVNSENKNSKG